MNNQAAVSRTSPNIIDFIILIFLVLFFEFIISFIGGALFYKSYASNQLLIQIISSLIAVCITLLWIRRDLLRNSDKKNAIGLLPSFQKAEISITYSLLLYVVLRLAYYGLNFAFTGNADFFANSDRILPFDPSFKIELLLYIASSSLIIPIFEELVFRGYLQTALAKHIPNWSAIFISSILFAFYHGFVDNLLSLFLLGLCLGTIYQLTKSIWLPIGVHILNNILVLIEYYFVTNYWH